MEIVVCIAGLNNIFVVDHEFLVVDKFSMLDGIREIKMIFEAYLLP
jgi:hypothetical protein